jgi:hypothetical protein
VGIAVCSLHTDVSVEIKLKLKPKIKIGDRFNKNKYFHITAAEYPPVAGEMLGMLCDFKV